MRMNKTASRLETVSWEENECEFCVVVVLVSQPLSNAVISRDASCCHTYQLLCRSLLPVPLEIKQDLLVSEGVCPMLVRVWDLFNVHLVLHSLELLKLKSRREIHKGVNSTKI